MTPHPHRYIDALPPPGLVYRLSCEPYEAMVEHGMISGDEPVWLYQGLIVWKGAPLTHPGEPGVADLLPGRKGGDS